MAARGTGAYEDRYTEPVEAGGASEDRHAAYGFPAFPEVVPEFVPVGTLILVGGGDEAGIWAVGAGQTLVDHRPLTELVGQMWSVGQFFGEGAYLGVWSGAILTAIAVDGETVMWAAPPMQPYEPTVLGDWDPAPATFAAALDQIAARLTALEP